MMVWLILAGAGVGLGLTLIIRELVPSHPDLGHALARLHAVPTGDDGVDDTETENSSRWRHRLGAHVRSVTETVGLPIPRRDLDLVGRTVESFLLGKVLLGLVGLAVPPVLAIVAALVEIALPLTVPTVASLGCAVMFFFLPDLDVRRSAARARREFRRALCSYVDLVALERLGDAGAVEALDRAADIGTGWVFDRIRDTLVRAHLAGISPWQGLNELAERVGVTELSDVGDIVALSGEDGAAVHQTLRARARALRTALLTDHESEANAASERLAIPVACLGLVFVALLVYPAIARILSQT